MAGEILVLDGDGIGPEVMAAARRVVTWFSDARNLGLSVASAPIGLSALEAHGTPLPDTTMRAIMGADAVLFGAMGGPEYDTMPADLRNKTGLRHIRKELDVYCNLRPITAIPGLEDASTLRSEVIQGVDLLIVRELTGGVYFGEPRGIETSANGDRRGVNTHVYTDAEIRRVAREAFRIAAKRQGRVHSVEKSNVMEAGRLWREEVTAVHAKEFPEIELNHMLADNCAMQLVRDPRQFDVILTDNLFGDLLSDCAAMITGSLGMLPSASLGASDAVGRRHALYEPVHGSAPDIAGRGIANPMAAILSFALCLRHSFGFDSDAALLERAVSEVLGRGLRTADLAHEPAKAVSTEAVTDAILEALDARANG